LPHIFTTKEWEIFLLLNKSNVSFHPGKVTSFHYHYTSTPITAGLGGVGFKSMVMGEAITAGSGTSGDGRHITAGSKTVGDEYNNRW